MPVIHARARCLPRSVVNPSKVRASLAGGGRPVRTFAVDVGAIGPSYRLSAPMCNMVSQHDAHHSSRPPRFLAGLACACTRFGAVYPPRPSASPAALSPTQRPHASWPMYPSARAASEPHSTMRFPRAPRAISPLRRQRHYAWQRTSLDVGSRKGGSWWTPTSMREWMLRHPRSISNRSPHLGSPCINTQYAVRLQSTT